MFKCYQQLLAFLFVLTLVGGAAFFIIIWTTAQAIGVSPDSVIYIEAARSFASDSIFFADGKLLTHYPPAYPFLLAIAGGLNSDLILLNARYLQAFLLAINAMLLAWIIYQSSEKLSLALIVAMMFVCATPVVFVHSMAWSEATFLLTMLLGYCFFCSYLQSQKRISLFLAACTIALALLTRYVAITLLIPIVWAFLFFDRRQLSHKIKDYFIFFSIALTPLGLWLLRNLIFAKTATNREMTVLPFDSAHLGNLVQTLHDFLLPVDYNFFAKTVVLIAIILLCAVCLFLFHLKGKNSDSPLFQPQAKNYLPNLFAVFAVAYILFLFVSLLFFDGNTPLDGRILLPVYVAALIAIPNWLNLLSKILKTRLIILCMFGVMLLSILLHSKHSVAWANTMHFNGRGYTSVFWNQSEVLAFVRTIPLEYKIYSNAADVIRFQAQRPALTIPAQADPGAHQVNDRLELEWRELCDQVSAGSAKIVFFNRITWRWYLPNRQAIESSCNLPAPQIFADGVVYGAK